MALVNACIGFSDDWQAVGRIELSKKLLLALTFLWILVVRVDMSPSLPGCYREQDTPRVLPVSSSSMQKHREGDAQVEL